MKINKVLVTGGLGFIGSETVVRLLEKGFEVVIVDNLSNSKLAVLPRIEKITGKRPEFVQLDCCDEEAFDKVFAAHQIDAVIHFAGLKAVGESVSKPLEYYSNNLVSSLTLLRLMKKHGVKNIVFSSSATVYGDPDALPLTEASPVKGATNPYGETKVMIERIIEDACKADKTFNGVLLRYFNPIGAHPSGLLGEDPNGIPNNLLPYIAQVAIGKRKELHVYGNDYPTRDGTCIRDYIHVVDLAAGHEAALAKLEQEPGLVVYNLGTGKGTTVFEVIKSYEKATGVKIPYVIDPRRPGDVTANFASVDKAKEELGWEAKLDVEEACRDSYRFQSKNPNGIE